VAGGDTRERTSLIITVLDEAATIDALLESIAAQTSAPDQIVFTDAGSTDGTWERLNAWANRLPLRLVRAQGANIARGRNLAIEAASGEVIAVTDAGVRLADSWLAELQMALSAQVDVVSGFFAADARTPFERAMGATVLPALDDIRPETFLPSSRSVLFRRGAWESAGGYPEWLDYGEDLVFDLALKAAGHRLTLAPRAIAWFRPRGSFGSFFRQYYLYARGDGKANLWPIRHAIRYATYGAAIALVGQRRPWAWLLLLAGAAAYTRRPYVRLMPYLSAMTWPAATYALALVPLIRLVGDAAKMLGYPVGVLWRLRTRWISRSSS
jgi:glycosyltransferase involved in cell wall biosynthesis